MEEPKEIKSAIIEVDGELIEVLERLRSKISVAAWDGLKKISWKDLTRILARKIKSAKLF